MKSLLVLLLVLLNTQFLFSQDPNHTAHEVALNNQVKTMEGFVELIKWAASGIVGALVLVVVTLWRGYVGARNKTATLLVSRSDERVTELQEKQKILVAVTKIMTSTNDKNEQLAKTVSILVKRQIKTGDSINNLLSRIRR